MCRVITFVHLQVLLPLLLVVTALLSTVATGGSHWAQYSVVGEFGLTTVHYLYLYGGDGCSEESCQLAFTLTALAASIAWGLVLLALIGVCYFRCHPMTRAQVEPAATRWGRASCVAGLLIAGLELYAALSYQEAANEWASTQLPKKVPNARGWGMAEGYNCALVAGGFAAYLGVYVWLCGARVLHMAVDMNSRAGTRKERIAILHPATNSDGVQVLRLHVLE